GEEERLLEEPRPKAAEPDREQRAERRVDGVAAVAPARIQPALEPVRAGHTDERAAALDRPDRRIGVLRDALELLLGNECAHSRGVSPCDRSALDRGLARGVPKSDAAS